MSSDEELLDLKIKLREIQSKVNLLEKDNFTYTIEIGELKRQIAGYITKNETFDRENQDLKLKLEEWMKSFDEAKTKAIAWQEEAERVTGILKKWQKWGVTAEKAMGEKESLIDKQTRESMDLRLFIEDMREKSKDKDSFDIYEEKHQYEVENQAFREFIETMREILYNYLLTKELSDEEKLELANILIKCGTESQRIVSLLILENKPIKDRIISNKLKIPLKEARDFISDLTDIEAIYKLNFETFTAHKPPEIVTTHYKSDNLYDIAEAVEEKLEVCGTVMKACNILEEFAVAVSTKEIIKLAGDINEKISEFRQKPENHNMLEIRKLFIEWKKLIKQTSYTEESEVKDDIIIEEEKLDPVAWSRLPSNQLIKEFKHRIDVAPNDSKILTEIVDALSEAFKINGKHIMVIMSINEFLKKYRGSPKLSKNVLRASLSQWEKRIL